MTILLDTLIDEIRDNIADLDFSLCDDKLIYNSLKDSYEFIQMITDSTITEEKYIRRCLIRLASYDSYRNWTSLAEVGDGTMPETSSLHLSTLLMKAYACLSLISTVPLNEDLSLKDSELPPAIGSVTMTTAFTR